MIINVFIKKKKCVTESFFLIKDDNMEPIHSLFKSNLE